MKAVISTIDRFRKGDAQAFELIYREESPRLGRFIRRYVRSVDLAEDIFQDVWVLAWRRRGQLRDPERFAGWFYRIARNRILEQSRKSRRGVQITVFGEMSENDGDQPLDQRLRDERPDPRQQAQLNEWTGLVDREVQLLEPLAREMIALRYGADLGLREIAEILDKPLGTVCAKVSRSLKQVRARLEEQGFEW